MPKYLNTLGNRTYAIGICDRCGCKFPYDELQPDPESPGLRVCEKDRDLPDPYMKPAKKPEVISLRYPRPDKELE